MFGNDRFVNVQFVSDSSKSRNSPSKEKGKAKHGADEDETNGSHEGKRHQEEDQPDSGSPSRKKLAAAR